MLSICLTLIYYWIHSFGIIEIAVNLDRYDIIRLYACSGKSYNFVFIIASAPSKGKRQRARTTNSVLKWTPSKSPCAVPLLSKHWLMIIGHAFEHCFILNWLF